MNPEEVKRFIKKFNFAVEFIEHSGVDGTTSEQAAIAHGVPIERIIKTLVFTDKSGKAAIVIIQGNKRVDTKKIPGLKHPDLVNAETLKKLIDGKIGGVAPLALPENLPKYVDRGVMALDEVYGSGGSPFTGIKFNPEILLYLPNYLVTDLAK